MLRGHMCLPQHERSQYKAQGDETHVLTYTPTHKHTHTHTRTHYLGTHRGVWSSGLTSRQLIWIGYLDAYKGGEGLVENTSALKEY